MKRTLMNRKSYMMPVVIIAIVMTGLFAIQLMAADVLIKWRKLDAMDTSFNIIENKAGDDDVLIELDVEDAGTYDFYYYLEDGRQTYIRFNQSYEEISIEYHVNENDGSGGITDITQDLVMLSYLEMNYNLTVPDWEYDGDKLVGASGGLEYSISRSASNKYPGVAFEINNKQVLIKWDFQADKIYLVIKNYEYGKIMPITVETPNKGKATIKVLKQLEDFEVTPTHYISTDGVSNSQVSPVEQPSDTSERPGSRPGLDITFKQPKELNTVTWAYEYALTDFNDITAIFELDDIGSDAYFDFNIDLKNDTNTLIGNIDVEAPGVNDNVVYVYEPSTHEYTIHIVKDKSTLAQKDTFVQWSELEASSLYGINVGFQVDLTSNRFDTYKFNTFRPVDKFAATYMAYELKRSNIEEAYLDVTPFNAGEQEEIEYIILYSKVIKESLDIDEDLWLKNYHTADIGNDEIFIPVPFRSTSSQDAYQIVVNFAGTQIYSQVLNYRAIDDDDVPPTIPDIELIENLFVVPPLTDASMDPEKVQFDVVWSAPTNKLIKELDTIFEDLDPTKEDRLFYELSINEVPTNLSANPFQVVKVFEVTKVDGDYRIDLYSTLTGEATGSNSVNFINGYNRTDETFRMDKVVVRNNSRWTNVLTTVIDDDTDTYSVSDTGLEADFEFPGVNYVRLKAITIKDGELSVSPMSIPESLSLSLNTYAVPIVDTLIYEPLYGVEEERTSGVTLEWTAVNTTNYETNMLAPISKDVKNILYTVYIAQDKASVLPLDKVDDAYHKIQPANSNEVSIDSSEIGLLRTGKVLYFDIYDDGGDDYLVNIEGLDANRDYNIRMVTKIIINDLPDKGNPDETRRSEPSSVLSATVPKTPGEPGDQEISPLAPETLSVTYADESFINALLRWHMPEEMIFGDDQNGFEIIAIEDRQLPDDLKDSSLTHLDLLNDLQLEEDVVEGWRMYIDDGVTIFEKYDLATGTYYSKNLNLISREDNYFTMIDDANAPNKVNYYYVRTVKMSDSTSKTTSPWVLGTLTTAPVKGPINLKVDYETDYTYNSKDELIVRFDAPIPDANLIGTDYVMEVHIKGEDDKDYSATKYPSVYLGNNEFGPAGYKRLFFHLKDLTPGKTYKIKVRIQDRTKPKELLPDGTEEYPKSPFSAIVTTRLEFDQETYDKENKYYEYLNYYYKKAEELKQLLYFGITGTKDETAVKYRENYSEGVIHMNSHGELTLYSDNKPINTYYIPSNSLALINQEEVTLVIESKEQIVGIRPDTIGVRITDEVNEIIDNIERYTSINEDWYLRITVYTGDYNGLVNGVKPGGPLVEVDFAIVGSRKLEEEMDDLMVGLLGTVIKANTPEVIAALEKDLELGINDRILLGIVEDVVEEVKAEYLGQASILFKGYLDKQVTAINELNKSYSIALKPRAASGSFNVHTKVNGDWRQAQSNYFNEHYVVEATTSSPYVTVPSSKVQEALVGLYGQEAVDTINAYDLTTVFSSYDLEHPGELLDKYQWISAVARVIGARAGEDKVTYLTPRGVYGTSTSLYVPMRYDEALMTYAQAFAYRHLIKLDRVNITDYGIIEDIDNVKDAYRLTLIRAANLGIISSEGGNINPSHSMNMREALKLLTTLHNGTD